MNKTFSYSLLFGLCILAGCNYTIDDSSIKYDDFCEIKDKFIGIGFKRIKIEDISDHDVLEKLKRDDVCSICMDYLYYIINDLVQFNCKHITCFKCANRLLKIDNKCPECRKKVPTGCNKHILENIKYIYNKDFIEIIGRDIQEN